MTTTQQLPDTFTDSASSQHPLEPLTAEEVATAVAIVRANHNFSEKIRFPMVVLNEPAKPVVLMFKEGDEIEREAFVNLLNNADGTTYTDFRFMKYSSSRLRTSFVDALG